MWRRSTARGLDVMLYDIAILWIWLGLSALVGVYFGWTRETDAPTDIWTPGWFRWAALAFVVGVVIAWFHFLPGRLGFWLETALLLYAAYFIGGLAGGFLRRAFAPLAAPPAKSAFVHPAAPVDVAPEPAVMGPVEGEENHEGQRPVGLVSARGGAADDLQRIKGIGPQNEGRLQALGIWHFAQIAAWTPDNVHWVGSYLSFPGRIDREQWIEQATDLAAGREPPISKRVEPGDTA